MPRKMMNVQLNKCGVVFDKERHTYHLGEKRLGGVTAIVKWMYPDTYKDIPEDVLMRAAEYGTMIHSKCEMADNLGIVEGEAVAAYMKMKADLGLQTVANEYLVTDGKEIASSIDVVLKYAEDVEPDEFPLADIKTTSKVHFENVRLQLSIYAYLFEKNNPGCKAGQLFVFWLPKPQYGVPQAYEVLRISPELCENIIAAYENGESGVLFPEMIEAELFGKKDDAPHTESEESLPGDLAEVEQELINIDDALGKLQERQKVLKEQLLKRMLLESVKKWSSDRLMITKKAASVRESVDATKLKKAHPEIYQECKKVSKVAESLLIKIL